MTDPKAIPADDLELAGLIVRHIQQSLPEDARFDFDAVAEMCAPGIVYLLEQRDEGIAMAKADILGDVKELLIAGVDVVNSTWERYENARVGPEAPLQSEADAVDDFVSGAETMLKRIRAALSAPASEGREVEHANCKWPCPQCDPLHVAPVSVETLDRLPTPLAASEGREVDTRLTKWFGDKGGGRIICGDKVLGRALTSEKIAEAHNSAIDVALRRISYLQRKCERAGASVRVETSETSRTTPAATKPTEYRYVQIGKEIAEELHFSWKRSMLRDLGRCAWKAVARQLSQRGRE